MTIARRPDLVCLVATAAMQAGKPTNYKGLEVTPLGIERAKNVALMDCPPGHEQRPRQHARREEFAVVTLAFKVTPAFKETIVKKPVLIDAPARPSTPRCRSSTPARCRNTSALSRSACRRAPRSRRWRSTPPRSISPRSTNSVAFRLRSTSPRPLISVPARVSSKSIAAAASSSPLPPTATSSAASTPIPARSSRRSRRCPTACSRSARPRRSIPRSRGMWWSVDRLPARPTWTTCAVVLARMFAKATHAIAVLDVPDERRQWMLHALAEIGANAIQIEADADEHDEHDDIQCVCACLRSSSATLASFHVHRCLFNSLAQM